MKGMKTAVILLAVLLLAGPGASFTTGATAASAAPAQRKDFQVALDILSAVTEYDQYTIFDDVTANVKDGVVTLTGKVTMPFKRDEIGKRVKKLRGVTEVRNQIVVLPASKFDDDLRLHIRDAIYNHSNFWDYASQAKPPIHIVVEGNRVTLSGIVHSDVDRKLAQSLAMQAGAGTVTNNIKTDAEARASLER